MGDTQTLTRQEWVSRVLGKSYSRPTPDKNVKQVKFAPITSEITPPPRGREIRIGMGRQRSNATITPPPKPTDFVSDTGKTLTITKGTDGRITYTAPPPPVKEITFSGGGGKGAALPGAVKALEESGVLKDAKKIAGASVGSMTAALVAAGITSDEFTEVANSKSTTDTITEGSGGTKLGLLGAAIKNKGNPLTGDGLEKVVGGAIDATLRKRITEYGNECANSKKPLDPDVVKVAEKLGGGAGATFMDFRLLSKSIPAVKEIVITGTYTTEMEDDGKGKGKLKKSEGSNEEGQLYVFDADSEPDLEIAIAVHASASFPVAFKPVDIKLSSGMTVRFIDGGVMNNTPTSSSLGNERDLDPMPEGRGMTFVFEDKDKTSKGLLDGKVKPSQGKMSRFQDWFLSSENAGAEYSKNRDMTDKPEEIVEVPLKIKLPGKKTLLGKDKMLDMRGGTLEFNLSDEKKLALQEATENATNEQIDRENKPKTREFASDSQMFVSIGMSELKTLAKSGYPGAADAVTFRERVTEMLQKIVEALDKENAKDDGHVANVLKDKNATMAFDELDNLAGKDVDFQGYVGRELNKNTKLDTLLEAKRKGGGEMNETMETTFFVSDAIKAHDHADNILKQLVFPKMKTENEEGRSISTLGMKKGAGIETLMIMQGLLLGAKSAADVNTALDVGIKHFMNKSDTPPFKRGHKEFAQQLERRKMPA